MGWKNNTPGDCCCVPFEDSCPCFEDTVVIGEKVMTVSGVVMSDPGYPTMNRTFSNLIAFPGSCTYQESHDFYTTDRPRFSVSGIFFTRLTLMDLGGPPPFPVLSFPVTFPPGVKAVASLELLQTSLVAGPHIRTKAIFHQVIPDANGFIDCAKDILGFVFNDQMDFDQPTFDASGASGDFLVNNGGGKKMACCGKRGQATAAASRFGEKVMVTYVGNGATQLVKVIGESTAVVYGYKAVSKPFCLYKRDADAQPALV